ncbi:MAG: Ig-like domain-containing protein [Bacteroidaceae bacterium]|nr:Ig-like domain-containing protein [Bacteroidaceae bacterium]
MKRNVVNFVSTIVFGTICMMTACSSEELNDIVEEEFVEGIHWQRADINLHVNRVNFDAQAGVTRSVDEGWKDGDRIYLILKDKDGNNVQAYVEYDATAASWGQVEYDGYKSYLTCTTPRTVEAYYFDGTVDVTASDITFDATTGLYVCMKGTYTYPADGDLDVNISLAPLTSRIRFTGESGEDLTISSGVKTYTAFSRATGKLNETEESNVVSVDATGSTPYIYGIFADSEKPSLIVKNNGDIFKTVFDSSTDVLQVGHSGYMTLPTVDSHRGWKLIIPATRVTLDRNSLVVPIGETTTLNAFPTPTNANSDIIWSTSDTSIVKVSNAGVVTAIAAGNAEIAAIIEGDTNVKAICSVTVVDANGHAYVDLGLPSGTLWATMDVGASSPSSGSESFAWGDVTGYDNYNRSHSETMSWSDYFSWSNYKYCNGTYDSMTKYCSSSSYGSVDYKTILELSDDAAHEYWGGTWRMPSEEQLRELVNGCNYTWTTLDGESGYLFTSKTNSATLFIVATNMVYTDSREVLGVLWARNRYDSTWAYCLLYDSKQLKITSRNRCYAGSVRPVLGSE